MSNIGMEHFPEAIHFEQKSYYFLHFEPLKKLQEYKHIFLTDKNDEDLFFEKVKTLAQPTQQEEEETEDFFRNLASIGFYIILSMDGIIARKGNVFKFFNMESNLKIKKSASNSDIRTFFFPPIYENMNKEVIKNIRIFFSGSSFSTGVNFNNLSSDLFILKLDKRRDYSDELINYDPFFELHFFPYSARICLNLNKEKPSRTFLSSKCIGKEERIYINTTLIKKELCNILDYIDKNPLDSDYYKYKQNDLSRIYGWPTSY